MTASSRSGGRTLSIENAVALVPASPAFVLEVLRDSHRHQCAFDPEADTDAQLSFDTSVAEWRDACDLVGTQGLGAALNELWDITIAPEAWKAVLEPPTSRTLRDVCDLIASQAQKTLVLRAGYLGASSRSAAAFLAVRSMLLRAGADPATIRPSAPIADMARRFPHIFLGAISRLAPGRLPTVMIRTPICFVALMMFLVGSWVQRCSLAGIRHSAWRPPWWPCSAWREPGSRPDSLVPLKSASGQSPPFGILPKSSLAKENRS